MSEEKHQKPFENNVSEEEELEGKRPHKIRRGPFEYNDLVEQDIDTAYVTETSRDILHGNVFDQVLEPQSPMKPKRLQDEGYKLGE